ncbi:diphosphate--fructose-6-phosphate 1-phosphotransferase [Bacillaceae bacterium SIJ1]|uniref:diphosphate--fructose-6-phosphate 1-phosphotransferase n=1 Tax=Litoribacterium kuwaitense TaxID=1398745 RepID=UPI0013EA8404|nr:diphosphate--fructose-6-phosphate 1-phosphotransferase [Litoribacterium kuwaitense]NGP45710.1 diphosphate--fructose-6-phosphate 1-phosphotransferase [Litoribacterium kuwaitense]
MKRIAVLQAGGPTPVLNASLASFVEKARSSGHLLFIQGGYQGLADGHFIEASDTFLAWICNNAHVPGACLGAGRFQLKEKTFNLCIQQLQQHRIDTLVGIGGNGTMAALHKLSEHARQMEMDLQIVGIPKTVDNDISCTDHAPGFGSAARYVATSTRDMSRDLLAMKGFEKVRVLETMGRHTGWLAAASGLLREYDEEGPHFIGIPEEVIDPEHLTETVGDALAKFGSALIVVSEGVLWERERPVARAQVNGRHILGGVSQQIAHYLEKQLGVDGIRSELFGMNQRSFSMAVSDIDRAEARAVGETAARLMNDGETDFMVSIRRQDSYTYSTTMEAVPIQEVFVQGEQTMPKQWIHHPENYHHWLRPLVGEGMPSYPRPL